MLHGMKSIGNSLCRFLLWASLGLLLACGFPTLQTLAQQFSPSLEYAQSLNLQGQQKLEQGDPQAALDSWLEAEKLYRQLGNASGAIGTQLNQAKALQSLGFYRRARTLLEQVVASQRQQSASALKANGLLSLGNILRLVGEYKASQETLAEGLRVAQQVNSSSDIQVAYLYLGNTLLAEHQTSEALNYFSQAAAISAPLQLSAQLRQFKLLQQLGRSTEATALLPQIESQFKTTSSSQLTIYGQIELASLLTTPADKSSPEKPAIASQSFLKAAQLLASTAQQAKEMGDRRAESYAIGRLGHLYEQTQQWVEAKRLTQKALELARGVNVPEILYQWQWQTGRILRSQNDLTGATVAYTAAVDTLRSIRNDLVAIGQEAQFSFRDQVEPVYRELVDLLLQPNASQENLKKARQTIESLKLAELNNFFREACLETERHPIDQVDQTAAVFYPIILPDRLEVILAIPGQPLNHYATRKPQAKIEAGIKQMLVSLRSTSFAQERQQAAQPIYEWLIQPAMADLVQHKVATLVFVPDGSLRSLPMAALYDGDRYLVEQFQIALAPSLELLNSRNLRTDQIHALIGGLSEGVAGSVPLPGVQQEVDYISHQIPAQVLLDRAFTTSALKAEMQTAPFNVVHLATHGQFSSKAQDTYIQTWDGRLTVNDLQALLNQRSLNPKNAIELLVLSACETAEGDNRATLGMAGIAVRSGAHSTLATLWNVNDASTAAFTASFYKAFTQPGVSKAEAVQKAQLSLIRSPVFNHPFYWAPFILVGNWA